MYYYYNVSNDDNLYVEFWKREEDGTTSYLYKTKVANIREVFQQIDTLKKFTGRKCYPLFS